MHSDSASDFISVTIKSVITHQMIDTLLYALKAKFLDVRLCRTVITDNESSASLSGLGKSQSRMHVPSFKSQPSLSGLKNVCVRSLPSSSGILKGSFLMLSYRFCRRVET